MAELLKSYLVSYLVRDENLQMAGNVKFEPEDPQQEGSTLIDDRTRFSVKATEKWRKVEYSNQNTSKAIRFADLFQHLQGKKPVACLPSVLHFLPAVLGPALQLLILRSLPAQKSPKRRLWKMLS